MKIFKNTLAVTYGEYNQESSGTLEPNQLWVKVGDVFFTPKRIEINGKKRHAFSYGEDSFVEVGEISAEELIYKGTRPLKVAGFRSLQPDMANKAMLIGWELHEPRPNVFEIGGGRWYMKDSSKLAIIHKNHVDGVILYGYKTDFFIKDAAEDEVSILDTILASDEYVVAKDSEFVVTFDGKYEMKALMDTINIDGEEVYTNIEKDDRIFKCYVSGNYGWVKDAIKLHESYNENGKVKLVSHKYISDIIEFEGARYLKKDFLEVFDGDKITFMPAVKVDGKYNSIYKLLNHPQTFTNPFGNVLVVDAKGNTKNILGIDNEKTRALPIVNGFHLSTNSEKLQFFAKRPVEFYKLSGGSVLYSFQEKLKSTTFKSTYGCRYSFGVEIETKNGYIPSQFGAMHRLAMVGDASIDGNEFTTSPAQGDVGIANIKSVCDYMRANGITTNAKCGTHIHISGIDKHAPVFNRWLSAKLIMLGVMIEDDIFSLYPTRDKLRKYCSSITTDEPDDNGEYWASDFSGINKENWRTELARYVFKRKSGDYNEFDRRHNKRSELGRWCTGRYRWLNLCLANNNSRGFNTVEFRVFPGTTSFEDIKSFIDISMAIVWFAENKERAIIDANESRRKRITLQEVLDTFKNRNIKNK